MGFFSRMVFTVNMVYQVLTVGLNPLQLVLVGTALEVSVMLFEVPTGVVADVYSRRLSVIIGTFVMGIGFVIQGLFPVFEAIVLAQIVWGLGWTFISGAKDAWIADEINDDDRLAKVYLRGTQLSYIGSLIAIGISVALATIHIQIPLVLGGIGFGIIGAFLIVIMPEDGFKPVASAEESGFENMKETLRTAARLVKGRPVLITIMLITLFYGLFSEGFDRLWTKHILDRFTLPGEFDSIIWFGIIGAPINFFQ